MFLLLGIFWLVISIYNLLRGYKVIDAELVSENIDVERRKNRIYGYLFLAMAVLKFILVIIVNLQ